MTVPTCTEGHVRWARAARAIVHAARCGPDGDGTGCPVCPSLLATLAALRHLTRKPLDAAGARLVLHDHVCISAAAGTCDGHDHARRTQAVTVAALRGWLPDHPGPE